MPGGATLKQLFPEAAPKRRRSTQRSTSVPIASGTTLSRARHRDGHWGGRTRWRRRTLAGFTAIGLALAPTVAPAAQAARGQRWSGRVALSTAERVRDRAGRQAVGDADPAGSRPQYRPLRQRIRIFAGSAKSCRTRLAPSGRKALPESRQRPATITSTGDSDLLRGRGPIAAWVAQPGGGLQYQCDATLVAGFTTHFERDVVGR
jgi:hypothetical protein